MTKFKNLQIIPADVAKYFLYRAYDDGETSISPLRMQKLVYYAYAWTLVKNHERLFDEKIEAWVNGPVVPSLYRNLKHYGRSPIDEKFVAQISDFEAWKAKIFPSDVLDTLEFVYQTYMQKTAFELVMSTHNEKPWKNAREGLSVKDTSSSPIDDQDIIEEYAVA